MAVLIISIYRSSKSWISFPAKDQLPSRTTHVCLPTLGGAIELAAPLRAGFFSRDGRQSYSPHFKQHPFTEAANISEKLGVCKMSTQIQAAASKYQTRLLPQKPNLLIRNAVKEDIHHPPSGVSVYRNI